MRRAPLLLMLLAACGGGSGPVTPPPAPPPPPPPPPAPVATVTLSRDTATLVPRQTLQLTAVTRDQNGAVLSGRTLTWASTATAAATVSTDGLVTAVAAGVASVSAASEGKSGATAITVKDGAIVSPAGGLAATADSAARVTVPAGALAAAQAITIAPVPNPLPNPRLIAGTAYDFGPAMTFAQAVTLRIAYNASAVVSADQTRLRMHRLTGGAWVEVPGSTVDPAGRTVSAPTTGFSTYAIVELAPVPVATVTLARDTATLVPQQTLQLVPVLKDQAGTVLTGRVVTWGSSAGAVASVSIDGLVTAAAAGSATITATSEGRNAVATITVKDGAIVTAAGGVAHTGNGAATVTIPAGALATARTITITPALNPPADPLLVPGTAFDFGPSGNFAQPVTITMSYAGTTVPVAIDPATLRLHRLTAGVWVPLPGSTVDVNAKTVTGQTGSFSTYAVLSVPPAPAAGSGILFQSDRDGNAEVYRMNPDGTGQTRITNALGFDGEPEWSPDGTRIVFTRGTDIYVMNADGTGVTRLTTNPSVDQSPTWSPDGSKIAFVSFRSGNDEIWVMNADGSNQIKLTNGGFELTPSWSPDGTRIAWVSTRGGAFEIWVMNADGSNPVDLTVGVPSASDPAWSPDGTRIAYGAYIPLVSDQNPDLYVMNADGSGKVRLTTHMGADYAPAWSPDGSQIAYTHEVSGQHYDIFVTSSTGGNGINISNHSGINQFPAWARPGPAGSPAMAAALPGHPRP